MPNLQQPLQRAFGEHEKVSQEAFNRLKWIFAPPEDGQAGAHKTELRAKWIGVYRGEGNQLYLADTDRLTRIIDRSWTARFPDQSPSIVSFIGQTGKSYPTVRVP